MKFGLPPKAIPIIQGVFKNFPQIEEVILFGSRAMGNFKEGSDVDFALKGRDIDLSLMGKIKGRLEEETSLPYFFDVVDFKSIVSPDLLDHIRDHGQVFFTKK